MGSRRNARICSLQMLYQIEMIPMNVEESIRLFWDSFDPCHDNPQGEPEIRQFSEKLVRGATAAQGEIDHLIQSSSKNWKLNRMAAVDRNILRLAVFELIALPDIPKRVSINEAIELGKKFGSEDSGSFINGVLDKISQGIPKE